MLVKVVDALYVMVWVFIIANNLNKNNMYGGNPDEYASLGRFLGFIALSFILWCGYSSYKTLSKKEIVSDTVIIPELKLTIKNNVVDTIYIYKEK